MGLVRGRCEEWGNVRSVRIPEIDGLRGISLTLVVLFHLFGHGRVSGGVDVFLTVSGFLLTLSLGRAIVNEKPLGVVARWGRTFSRLAPPAALVLVAVMIASFTVLSPLMKTQNLSEVVASALYFENWQLIGTQLAYGAAGPETSPLQHFWSLSVQAQFFILFPVVAIMAVRLFKRVSAQSRAFWFVVVAATAASFVYAWYSNGVNPQAAYFNTFARFWELGIGGLVAGVMLCGWSVPPRLRALGGWLGLAMIVSSGLVFDGGAAYPGPAALFPVGGAALVLLSSSGGAMSPSRLLASRPLVYLDKISYGLYLWHWPVLIVYLTMRGNEGVGWRGACLVLGVAVVLTLATRWILQFVHAWASAGRRRRAAAVAVIAVLVGAVPASGMLAAEAIRASVPVALSECAGAAVLDEALPKCQDALEFDSLAPTPETARDDDGNRAECWTNGQDATFRVCTLGPEDYTKYLIAIGDSHNNQWVEAYAKVAEDRGWRIDVAGRGSCGWSHAQRAQATQFLTTACESWKDDVENYLMQASGVDGVIVAESSNAVYKSDDERVAGYVSAWSTFTTAPILALRDNSMFDPGIMSCVGNREYVESGACKVPRESALRENGFPVAVEQVPGAKLIDLSDYMCTDSNCPMVLGNVLVSRDGSHLTATFTETLAPYLAEEIELAL